MKLVFRLNAANTRLPRYDYPVLGQLTRAVKTYLERTERFYHGLARLPNAIQSTESPVGPLDTIIVAPNDKRAIDLRETLRFYLRTLPNENVVRCPIAASDKPDLGLEELSSLNVKSRFQVFEKAGSETNEIERSPSQIAVKRSPSILSKLAK